MNTKKAYATLAESLNANIGDGELFSATLNAATLVRSISQTNNGYLFAPTQSELELADKFPAVFKVTRTAAKTFPNRIALLH